jgi:hypothetical protein
MNEVLLSALRNAAASFKELTATKQRPSRASFRPGVEALEDRSCPAAVNLYWDPTSGNNASLAANWDTNALGSGTHPAAAPGNINGETDSIYFDGTTGKGGNTNCTWDYTPTNTLDSVKFQNGWNQQVTFNDKQGFSISISGSVSTGAAPVLKPNGISGANAVAAITLTGGTSFQVGVGSTLFLQSSGTGGAVFFAGDGQVGDYLDNSGTVSYLGSGAIFVDYLKIPVHNIGVFQVNGKGTSTAPGSTLQVSGSDKTNTNGVSFYQNGSTAQTNILGAGTLWCVNDYTMTAGKLQTTDSLVDYLQVGTGGSSPVDGTVTLSGGTVNIDPGTNVYGTLDIIGTTLSNAPTVNVGSATLNFKVNMVKPQGGGANQSDRLIVGKSTTGSGALRVSYNGGTTTVSLQPQGTKTTDNYWLPILFGSEAGDVTLNPPTGYNKTWEPNDLKINN